MVQLVRRYYYSCEVCVCNGDAGPPRRTPDARATVHSLSVASVRWFDTRPTAETRDRGGCTRHAYRAIRIARGPRRAYIYI